MKTNISDSQPVITFAQANVNPRPIEFARYKSDIPIGTKATTLPLRIQLETRDAPKSISRNTVIATHWLNPPLNEAVISVASLYHKIRDMAFNYQREHPDGAFFETYPECLILSEDEKASPPDVNELRRNYKDYSSRLAHYVMYYLEAYKMYAASLANIVALSKFQGEEPISTIANHTRMSLINSNTPMFGSWPAAKGVIPYILNYTRYGVGKTTYGADILSIPMWITDIFGNRGFKFDSYLNRYGLNSDDVGSVSADIVKQSAARTTQSSTVVYESDDAEELTAHIDQFIRQYGSIATSYEYTEEGQAVPTHLTARNPYSTIPMNMPIQNGFTAQIKNGSAVVSSPLNFAGIADPSSFIEVLHRTGKISNPAHGTQDQLSEMAWNTFKFWQNYLIANFGLMYDPQSSMRVFVQQELGVVENGYKVTDFVRAIRNANCFTLDSLSKAMVYKSDNKVTTTTVVRGAQFFIHNEQDYQSITNGTVNGDPVFDLNFKRFDFPSENTANIIQSAKRWPGITPTIFTSAAWSDEPDASLAFDPPPIILNAAPSWSSGVAQIHKEHHSAIGQDKYNRYFLGADTSLLDQVSTTSLLPDETSVIMDAVTQGFAEEYVTQNNGLVFEENPTTVFAQTLPLIDNSDIYQCGFNVFIANNVPHRNAWDEYFTSRENFEDSDSNLSDPRMVDSIAAAGVHFNGLTATPTIPRLTKNVPVHTASAAFMSQVGNAIVFVGGAIFGHPYFARAMVQSGNPSLTSNAKRGNDVFDKLVKESASIPTTGFSTLDTLLRQIAEAGATMPESAEETKGTSKYSVTGMVASFLLEGEISQALKQSSNAAAISFSLFNPCYGDVTPILQPLPAAGIGILAPSGTWSNPLATAIISRSTNKDILSMNNRSETIESTSAADFYMYFLESIKYKYAKVDDRGVVHFSELAADTFDYQFKDQYPFTLMNKTKVTFAGLEDTKPFWAFANIDMRVLTPPLATTADLPEQDVVAEPRVAANTRDKGTSFGIPENERGRGSGSRPSPRAGASNSKNSGRRPHKRSPRPKQGNNKGFEPDQLGPTESLPVQGKFDPATKAEKKEVDNVVKKTGNVDSLFRGG